jgi:fermentation-respiration switch protein FrsA (DUF1100 family)
MYPQYFIGWCGLAITIGKCRSMCPGGNAILCFVLFRYLSKAPIPVFILHGLQDQVVPVSNGQALYQSLIKAQKSYQPNDNKNNNDDKNNNAKKNQRQHYTSVAYPPLWIPDVGHNDMPEFDCMKNISNFLEFLRKRQVVQ